MKEGTLSGKMARRVRDRGGWCRKVHGGTYGAGWPDLMGVYKGLALCIEVKMPGRENTVTELQAETLANLRKAGALAFVLTSMKQLNHLLDAIDRATEWPVTELGIGNQLDRLGREAKERLKYGFDAKSGTLEQRLGPSGSRPVPTRWDREAA